jgi:hypothetical protein
MVFWDSRTQHCGTGPLKGRLNPKQRAVIYTCYTPTSEITETDRKKKIHAIETGRTTNHWPHKPKMFPKNPRTYGKALPIVKKLDSLN